MSEPWWRRKKNKRPSFNDIYKELERLGDLIDESIQKAFETSSAKKPARPSRIQGFSTKIGPDGKPRIHEFNNRKSRQKKAEFSEDQEPLVDIMEAAETLIVLAALPGVGRNAIEIRTTENRLTISVEAPNLEFRKELRLPARVDPKSAHVSYKNGVLEVKLKKLDQSTKIIKYQ